MGGIRHCKSSGIGGQFMSKEKNGNSLQKNSNSLDLMHYMETTMHASLLVFVAAFDITAL
jgi:hypothetical protein